MLPSPTQVYAGRAVTRAVTLQSVDPAELALGDEVEGLDEAQLTTMATRIDFYLGKFDKVGSLALQ